MPHEYQTTAGGALSGAGSSGSFANPGNPIPNARCVCDLVALTSKRQPYISQHLATLRDAGLVISERQGWNICYQLNDTILAEFEQFISVLLLSLHQPDLQLTETKMAKDCV